MKNIILVVALAWLGLVPLGRPAETRLGVQSKGPQEYMFVSGDGKKAWYSALELEQIARTYISDKNLDFSPDGTEKTIWVHTDGGKVLAEVWFTPRSGKAALQIFIGRKGNVLKHTFLEKKKD